MELNKNWTFYCVKDSEYKQNPNVFYEEQLKKFTCFKHVNIPCLFEDIIKDNNLIGDVYKSTNMWEYAKYEDYHQFYVKRFKSDSKEKFITFKGVDCVSEIFVNGKLIGKTNNQFLPFTFKLDDLRQENGLIVHILPNVVVGRSYDLSKVRKAPDYCLDGIYLRKTISSFGWDILPRTCLGGIFREIVLKDKLDLIKDIHITSNFKSLDDVDLSINTEFLETSDADVLVEVNFEDKLIFKDKCPIGSSSHNFSFNIKNPNLWTIRGYGKQNLYDIKVSILRGEKLIESKTIRYGIRKVELKRSSIIEENGKFEFYINDQKVFLLGSNYVPIDALKHIDNNRMKKALKLVTDIGCNALRIWGGGTYETDEFYNLCDELGIFLWQDFMMGCGCYMFDDEEFCGRLKIEFTEIVKRLRNHPSICLWAGDNENDVCAMNWLLDKCIDPNINTITRKLIPDILKEYDSARPFLPSSPYIDEVAFKTKKNPSEDHLWGPRDYFKGEYYKNAYPYFTSETGYHALNSPKSLKKFLNEPWPIFDDKHRPTKEYLCHAVQPIEDYNGMYAYRIKLMTDQVITLFGKSPDNLHDFAIASQISQAEAMKFFIEKMRKDYARNGGIIWWNILDGWPQISDAVVDYYFNKKAAYNYIKNSQQDSLLMMNENDDGTISLILSSSLNEEHDYSYRIIDGYNNEELTNGNAKSIPHSSVLVDKFKRDEKHHFFIIEYIDENNKKYINHFHTNIINIDFNKYYTVAKKYGLLKLEGF